MEPRVKTVQVYEYVEACKNWHRLYGDGAHFQKFIGNKNQDLCAPGKIRVSNSAYNKIQLLKSPHYRTLMKAFIARTGYHKRFK